MAIHSSILAWKILQTDHEVSKSDTTEQLTFSLSAPLMLLKRQLQSLCLVLTLDLFEIPDSLEHSLLEPSQLLIPAALPSLVPSLPCLPAFFLPLLPAFWLWSIQPLGQSFPTSPLLGFSHISVSSSDPPFSLMI